jgi:renal tumor antigen
LVIYNKISLRLPFAKCTVHIPHSLPPIIPEYKLISKKGEGTFSEVLKAQSLKSGNYVAIKCMKQCFQSIEQVNHLREIQALRKLSPHEHVIKLLEVL